MNMKWNHVRGNTWCIEGRVCIPVYLLNEGEAVLLDSGYVMPLYNETYTWLLRDTFTGLHTDGMGVYYFQNVVKTSS